MSDETFLWHDYETFGTDPRRDRPCQFAALRTDADLEPAGEPVVWYCRPTRDMLPHPEACLITGITPQLADERGLPEFEFARRIHALMSEPGTCTVGYNNFRFDDEVSRFLFWRNFLDPYAREYRNGNSRLDLIDVLRAACALRPDGIEWPESDPGVPSFRLEDLAKANGLPTERAHDALADVENTLGMARLLRRHQRRLWDWCLGLRARPVVEKLVCARKILLHVSARYPAGQLCIAPILPLARHPHIASQWLVWNLREDPDGFIEFDTDTLADLYWTPGTDLPEGMRRLPVKWIRTNRCPVLAPMTVLDERARQRSRIDPAAARDHAATLEAHPEFIGRIIAVFQTTDRAPAPEPESALYEGFPPDGDRALAERIASRRPEDAAVHLESGAGPFVDDRLNELLIHYIGRHAEDRLPSACREAWNDYRRARLVDDPDLAPIRLDEYRARLAQLRHEHPEAIELLTCLAEWPDRIGIPDPNDNEASTTWR